MEERASGIILRTRPLTETSLIVQWLTSDAGRISTVAKGARRPKSPFLGKLDLFYEADFSFVRSRKSELHTLRELGLRQTHAKLREDLSRLHAAAYCAVLLEQGTERETPIPEFYALAVDTLQFLDQSNPTAAFVFGLELKFLALSGMIPSFEGVPEETTRVAEILVETAFIDTSRLDLSKSVKAQLSSLLRRGIGMTLEKLPPQRERLLQNLNLNSPSLT
jgi:DNA repair protein RecO (recombination protein O)